MSPLRVGVVAALVAFLALGCSSPDVPAEATASSSSHVTEGKGGVTSAEAGAKLVTVDRATLFAEPKKKSSVVRTLAVGIEVTAVGDAPQNGFVHVTVADDEGWMQPRMLKLEDAPAPTGPATGPSPGGGAGDDDDTTGPATGPDPGTDGQDPNAGGGPQGTGKVETCQASFYGEGQETASGEPFDPSALTAAHKTLPFDTMVRVTNTANGKTVDVRINDRGPFVDGRCIDLSTAAFDTIADESAGVADVTVEVLQ